MKLVIYWRDGRKQKLRMDDATEFLTEMQIWDGIQAKEDDPNEEVSYMIPGGVIVFENE